MPGGGRNAPQVVVSQTQVPVPVSVRSGAQTAPLYVVFACGPGRPQKVPSRFDICTANSIQIHAWRG